MEIREYRKKDLPVIERLMNDFEDYLISIDKFQRLKRGPEFGNKYTKIVLKKIKKGVGKMLVVTKSDEVIGFGAAIIEKQSESDLLEEGKIVSGEIIELFVDSKHRNNGLGRQIILELENFLKSKGCERISIGVIASNPAYDFYHKLGYRDLYVDLLKKI